MLFARTFLRRYLNKVTLHRLICFAEICEFFLPILCHNSPNLGKKTEKTTFKLALRVFQEEHNKNRINWDSNFCSLRKADVSPCSSTLRDFSRRGTSATQRQKFHTDDVNRCLHNKSGSHGVPNANLFNLHVSWSILEKCCVHLRMSSSKTQILLLEKTIFHKYWLFC